MATSYPGSVDTTNLTNPATTDKRNSPSHAGLHANANDAIKAVETKIGTGSSTPVVSTLLFGTGTGTSAWQGLTSAQLAAVLSDETGTGSAVFATTPTLVTPKIDTINESTLNNGVTVGGVNLKGGFVNGSAITAGTVGSSQAATGLVVQVVGNVTGAVATGTTTIPNDDTIPQNTEGDQYLSQAITPKSSTNVLVIEGLLNLSASIAGQNMAVALFQDTTANALAVGFTRGNAAGSLLDNVVVRHIMVAGTTSATTFKIRAGGNGAATTTLNGQTGARLYGGVLMSSITITEYKA